MKAAAAKNKKARLRRRALQGQPAPASQIAGAKNWQERVRRGNCGLVADQIDARKNGRDAHPLPARDMLAQNNRGEGDGDRAV